MLFIFFFFFSSRRRHTRCSRDWSSDVCSSDLLRARSVCYHAQRKRSSRSYQHEHGGPHAFDIAYAQMRCDCANKVDHETNACRDAHPRSEEHTSELQSRLHLGCRLLLEKKKADDTYTTYAGASASRANAIARRAATASLSACLVVTW